MDQENKRFYPSAPLKNIELEKRLEKKVDDVNSFKKHIKSIK